MKIEKEPKITYHTLADHASKVLLKPTQDCCDPKGTICDRGSPAGLGNSKGEDSDEIICFIKDRLLGVS